MYVTEKIVKFYLILGYFFVVSNAFGQKERLFETLTMSHGLSQGMVFDMIQDREGFLWVATKDGLNRYDGYSFKIFTNDPYNQQSLSSNTVSRLYEDSQGRIWVGTENQGLNIFNKEKGDFLRIIHQADNPESLSGNGIKAIEEISNEKMMVATDKAGLNIIHVPSILGRNKIKTSITKLSLPDGHQVWGMGKDKFGRIWVGSMGGSVYEFDENNVRFIQRKDVKLYHNGYLNPDGTVLINHYLFLDTGNSMLPLFDTLKIKPGNIVFKTRKALWDYFHREPYFYDISIRENGKYLAWNQGFFLDKTSRVCYPFLIDKSGILWSGSVGYGLRKYTMTRPIFTTQGSGKSVRMIVPGMDDDLFFVDYGYGWYHLKNNKLTTLAFSHLSVIKQIDQVFITSDDEFWFRSDDSGYYHYNPITKSLKSYPELNSNLKLGKKQPFLEDSKGRIWIPGLNGKIMLLDKKSGRLDSLHINPKGDKMLITVLLEGRNSVFWVGTENGFAKIDFSRVSASSANITWYYNDVNIRNSLSYNHVSCFLNDPSEPEKYLWVATRGGGLNRFDIETGDFFHLNKKDGMPDDVVYGLLTDEAGNIWGSTNKGIFCMSSKKERDKWQYSFRNFNKSLGLQDDEFNTGAFAKLRDGKLAFGGVNGINVFNPKEVLKSGFSPNVYITSILVGNKEVVPNDKTNILSNSIEYTKSISLHHEQDILTLEFSALDFTDPSKNIYRYQLKGIDETWVESGQRRTATYLHLPAGKYTFKVQGSNSQGVWSDQVVSLDIHVKPPWWLTWWSYLLYFLIVVYIIRTYLKFRVNKAKLESQLDFEQQEANRIKDLDMMKTQLYANITHEFRTPLTVILGMANQIKTNPDKYVNSGLDMITRNGLNLLNLVNQMLDLSKLENGKMNLQLQHGDIIAYLRYIVESFQSLAAADQKQFHFLPELGELEVAFDAEKIRQIISNIFSNAIKFTPSKGNIYMSVSQQTTGKNDEVFLTLKIKDTGIGIPENQIPHIFDRFFQSDNSHTRMTQGTGIGLALTKELVKLMQGEISVESPPVGANKGTEFIIKIPFSKITTTSGIYTQSLSNTNSLEYIASKKTSIPAISISDIDSKGKGPLVLLVEDNADVVAYTASCLQDYRLAVGNDGKEGFDIAVEIIPDLIISDVMMPNIDGFEMCNKLRKDERTSHIPIIMLTAKADIQSKLHGLEKGADVYLEKPFHKEELLLHIRKLIDMRKNLQQYYLKHLGLTALKNSEVFSDVEVNKKEPAEHGFIKKLRGIVEANFNNSDFNVEQLCKLVYMSHSQLHRKLEALSGQSPNHFIRMVRLNKAKSLLENPSLSIATVSLESGYNDPGYFTRVFKQETGLTPQEWRTRNFNE